MRSHYWTCCFIVLTLSLIAQTPAPVFKTEHLSALVMREINNFRISKGLDTLEAYDLLLRAADMSSQDLADNSSDKTKPELSVKYLQQSGLSRRGEEITMKAGLLRGRMELSAEEVAKAIYTKWLSNGKCLAVLMNPRYTLCGFGATMDEEGEHVYASLFTGGPDLINNGSGMKESLVVPFNTKSKKMVPADLKVCRTCNYWRFYELLHDGLYTENGKVYLRFPDQKMLRQLLRLSKDGLAIDVVQRQQYDRPGQNIVDFNLASKGVMGKVIYRDDIFKKNLLLVRPKGAKPGPKPRGLVVELGTVDPKITGPFEINLLVVQQGKICRTVLRHYTEYIQTESKTPIGFLPYPKTTRLNPPFNPKAESSILTFMIPFEKNKSEFREEDVAPFVKALNEPSFKIEGLYIYAYSSIEGDSGANARLQHRRAENVAAVLQKMQKSDVKPVIQARDSWGLFLLENEDGKYAPIVALGKRGAIDKINSDKNLLQELEPVLARERFAQVILDVSYDLGGDKEKILLASAFKKAVKSRDSRQANRILEYASKKMMQGALPADIFDTVAVTTHSSLASVINNRIYYRFLKENRIEAEDARQLDLLLNADPSNPVLKYNRLYCDLRLDSSAAEPAHRSAVQEKINSLYGHLDSSLVNGLNIEWQFRIIEALDSISGSESEIEACTARIKKFYNASSGSWENAVKLAQAFSRSGDHRTALQMLDPFLQSGEPAESLLYTYLSISSKLNEKHLSRNFAKAYSLAAAKNRKKSCELIGPPYLSFQVLENPQVKKTYLDNCK